MYREDKYFDTDRLLDEVLKTDTGVALPNNFADKLAAKISRRMAWRQYTGEFLIYLGVIAGVASVLVIVQFTWFEAKLNEWLQFVISNLPVIAGTSLLLVFILFADRVLLRFFLFHRSEKKQ